MPTLHTITKSISPGLTVLAILNLSCSDDVVGGSADDGPSADPAPLESILFEALGHGTLAFQRFPADESPVGIYVVDADEQTVYGFGGYNYHAPALSPDGTRFAFVRFDPEASDDLEAGPDIHVADSRGGDVQRHTILHGSGFGPAWVSGGSQIAYFVAVWKGSTPYLEVYRQSSTSDATDRVHVQTFNGLCGSPNATMSVSSEGVALFSRIVCGGEQEIVSLDLSTGEVVQVLTESTQRAEGRVDILSPAWSADGQHISYMERVGDLETLELIQTRIKTMDADGRNTLTVASVKATGGGSITESNASLVWSPDGSKIAFTHQEGEGVTRIYVVGREGEGLQQITSAPDGEDVSLSWVL